MDLVTKLRYCYSHHFRALAYRSRLMAEKWITTMRTIAEVAPPTVAAVTLRAGLHGWSTAHRCGNPTRRCIICNREGSNDSLDHISRCIVTRRLWDKLMPGKIFCNHALLGFNAFLWTREDIAHCAMTLYGVYEFYRFWGHTHVRHSYNVASCVRAIIHFATTDLSGGRGSVVRNFMHRYKLGLH